MIKTTGLHEELKKIKALPGDIDRAMTRELNMLGLEWVKVAKDKSPWDTGTYRRAHTFKGTVKANKEFRVEVSNNVDYAEYIEFPHREFVYGRPTGRIRPGQYVLHNSRREIYAKLPAAIRKAYARAEVRFNAK